MRNPRRLRKPPTALLLAAFAAAPATLAAASDWLPTAGGLWSDPANWSAGVPNGSADTAVFSLGFPNGSASIDLDAGTFTVNAIDANNIGILSFTNGMLVFSETALGIDPSVTTGPDDGFVSFNNDILLNDMLRLDAAAGTTIRLLGLTAGTGGITASGAGLVVLDHDAAAWTGNLTVEAGTVQIADSNALGVAGLTTVTGGLLQLDANTDESFIAFGGAIAINSFTTQQGDLTLFGASELRSSGGTLAGQLGLAAGNTAVVRVDSARTLLFTGGTSGPGAMRIDAAGTVRFTGQPLMHTGGLTLDGGTVRLETTAAFGGDLILNAGTFDITTTGSLVDIGGTIDLQTGGTLILREEAGSDPEDHSVASQSIHLNGGILQLANNIDAAGFLHADSTGGRLLLNSPFNYTAGGTNLLDLNAMPGGENITLGAATNSAYGAALQLVPHASDHTLRFGGGSATLRVRGEISDIGADPTHIAITGPALTQFDAANTYTGETVIHSGTLFAAHPDALGAGSITRVLGGQLRINGDVNEALEIDGGTLRLLSSTTYTMPIDFRSGTILAGTPNADLHATLAGPITVTAGGEALLDGSFDLNTSVSGTGGLNWLLGNSFSDRISTINAPLTFDGGLIVDADLDLYRLEFRAPSTYAGVTELSTADFAVYDPMGLGSAAAGTVLHSGELEIYAATNEHITLHPDGRLLLFNGGDFASLTSHGGEFLQYVAFDNDITLVEGITAIGALNGHIDSHIAGAGDLRIGEVTLDSANSYTGTTYVAGFNTIADHTMALGSTDGGTVVLSGELIIDAASLEPIRVEGGTVNFRVTDGPNLNPLTLADFGAVTTTGAAEFAGSITLEELGILRSGRFTGPIAGDDAIIINHQASSPDTIVAGVNPFTGTVTSVSDTVYERADVFNHAHAIAQSREELTLLNGSDRTIFVSGANLRFENDTTLQGLWLIDGGLGGPGAVTADRLVVGSLNDNNQPAGNVTVNDFVLINASSRIDSRLQGTGDLIIDGNEIHNFATATALTGDLVLIDGTYRGYRVGSFIGSGGTIRFTHGSTASLQAPTSTDENNRIARTVDATDTYFAEIIGRVTGTINLSDGFELFSADLEAAGQINAHDLTLSGGALTGTNLNGLTGNLTVTPDFERGDVPGNEELYTLRLGDNASLQNLDTVTLSAPAILTFDNAFSGNASVILEDRLRDTTGIISHGGLIRLVGSSGTDITETVGDLTLRDGRTRLLSGNSTSDAVLAITSLQREGRASVGFDLDPNDTTQGEYMLLNPGVAEGEMIGPWATTSLGFATIDDQNFVTTVATTSINISAAAPTDHVLLQSMQTLSADNTVRSVVFDVSGGGGEVELDLSGNTLTVGSGGLFLTDSAYLHSGTVTAGGDELIFAAPPAYVRGDNAKRLTLNAEIADNGSPVALILDSVTGELGGDFNHTGGTWIHNSNIDINDTAAVPVGGDLHLHGTEYEFRLTADADPVAYGTITIDGGSRFTGPYFDGSSIGVTFNQIKMGSGYLSANLTGDGLIHKDMPGYLWMNGSYHNFTGDILVDDGHLLVVGALNDAVDITINGGMFSTHQAMTAQGSAIQLAGGTLAGGGNGYLRDIHVTADAYLLGVEIDSAIIGSSQLTIRHDLASSSSHGTVILEDADLSAFTGDWFLESGYASFRPEADGMGTGDITINPGATLQFFGNTNTSPGNNHITLDGGGTLYATDEATHAGDIDASGIVRLGARHQANALLDLAGQVRLHDGLSILGRSDNADLIGMGTVRLSGEILVGSDVRWNPGFTSIDITGTVRPDTADASILFAGLINIPASAATFDMIAGRTLTLRDDIGPGSLTLRDGGAVVGDGTLRADVTADTNAIIAPGHGAGALTIDGQLTMLNASTLRSELFNSNESAGTGYDQLIVTGTFTAGGTLDLSADASFAPNLGDTFDLVTASAISGTFNQVTGSAIDELLGLTVHYLPTAIRVEAGLLGDLTGDGFVGGEDLDLILANWGDTVNAGDWRVGDADGSGAIGQGDLQIVINHWSNGTPPDTNIPEPGSLALLALSSIALLRRRRR